MEAQDAIELLERTIRFDLRHEHYDETLKVKEFCHQVMDTDVNSHAEILMKWRDKQSKEQRETTLKLYNSLTTYALNPVMNLYKRVHRVDSATDVVEHKDDNKEQVIKGALNKYYAGSSVRRYINEKLLHYNFFDPNSFILTERKDIRGPENNIVKINPYPFEVSSDQAVNYHYENGVPIWLIIEQKRIEISYKVDNQGNLSEERKEVSDFYFYATGLQVKYSEFVNTEQPDAQGTTTLIDKTRRPRKFATYQFQTGTTEFPGRKTGAYNHPIASNVRVPLYWAAKPVLIDLINHKATLDVSINKHIYPKKFAYVTRCEYQNNASQQCVEGYLDGDIQNKCPICKGSGSSIHYSEQDLIEFKLPKDHTEWSSLPKLSDLSFYEQVPIEVTEYIGRLVESGPKRVQYALFNTSLEESPVVATTATEEMHNWENVNVAASPYAQCWSQHYELVYRITAQYYEYQDGFTVDHEFPKDLKLEGINTLIARLKAAKESGMSYDAVWAIECDIITKLFSNSLDKIDEIKAKELLKPFRGASAEMAAMILQSRAQDDPDRIFYENFAKVIDVAEELAGMPIYLIDPNKRGDFIGEAIGLVLTDIRFIESTMPSNPLKEIINDPAIA